MIRKITILLVILFQVILVQAQTATSFDVGGDFDKFYPVVFSDANWFKGMATEIELGRSDTHYNSAWRGTLISKFRYHTSNYGHGSDFIEAYIMKNVNFIGGWADATSQNGNREIIIWLKGGGTTYFLNSLANVAFRIYDGVQNPLPFEEINGPSRTYKSTPDDYALLNSKVISTNMLIAGNVGIGTNTPREKLSVNGNIRAKEIKVEATNWPDYVFATDYKLIGLNELEEYIKTNKHLPDVPAAATVAQEGIALGEMNKILLKKIEELTLLLIDQNKSITLQQNQLSAQEHLINTLRRKIDHLKPIKK